MDSGNSGSMQSSSTGGDDDFDSRGESISSFLNPSGGHFGSISSSPHPNFLSQQQQQTSFFDPLIMQPASANNDLVWTRSLRSDQPNYAAFGNLAGSSSLSASRTQNLVDSQGLDRNRPGPGTFTNAPPSVQLQAHAGSEKSDHHHHIQPNNNSTNKNPKKRPRASRRAPTTVLTTDTTNFRQMVQEFTGIPAAPFSGPPYSRRLDLFSSMRSGNLEGALGSLYPLRPSAQKVQVQPSMALFNSSVIDAMVPPSTNISTANVGTLNNNSNNFQLPSDVGIIPKQPQNLLNLQNQINVPIQSLLHSSSIKNHQLGAVFGSLGMSHDHHVENNLSGFPNLENSSATAAAAAAVQERNETNIQENMGPFGGRIGSEFQPEKGLESVTSGADATVSSWICPSD